MLCSEHRASGPLRCLRSQSLGSFVGWCRFSLDSISECPGGRGKAPILLFSITFHNKHLFHPGDADPTLACPSVRLGTSVVCELITFHSSTPWGTLKCPSSPNLPLDFWCPNASDFRRFLLRCHLDSPQDIIICPLTSSCSKFPVLAKTASQPLSFITWNVFLLPLSLSFGFGVLPSVINFIFVAICQSSRLSPSLSPFNVSDIQQLA